MSLVVEKVSKHYGNQWAVQSLNFVIQPGEVVGFLGPNGAGKSTTLKMIAGFLSPDEGTIFLHGIDIQKNPIEAKRLIGYLPELNPLYEDLYVKEYLHFIASVHQLDNPLLKIKSVIDVLDIGTMQHKKISDLSKGFKQRVGLAAAIIHQPSLLLLDEPNSGLDPHQLTLVRNVIKEYSKQAMVLFSSHILQEVTAICNQVLVMHQGKLVANETIENLVKPTSNNLHIVFEEEITHCAHLVKALNLEIVSLDKHLLVVKTVEGKDVKKIIMQFALDMGLHIERLHTEQASLEEIFKLLTH
jgi:ABC-2 type transport system ATP-binding protein